MVLPVYFFFVFFFFFLFADLVLPLSSASGDCPPFFDCGNLAKLSFPLTTPQRKDCGMLPIHGCEDPNAQKTVLFGKKMLQVIRIDASSTVVFVRDADLRKRLVNNSCDALCRNVTLPPKSPLGSFSIIQHITTFYKCNITLTVSAPKQFLNYTGCGKSNNEIIFFQAQDEEDPPPALARCPRVRVPVNSLAFSTDLSTLIASEFAVLIQLSHDCILCVFDKGSCRLNSSGGFYCLKFKDETETEDQNNRRAWKLGLIMGIGAGLGILILALLLCFGLYKQKHSALSHVRLRSANQYPNDADPDSGRLFFGVPIFSYMELQDATKNFDPSNKLGDGGFGSVFYGKLQDGREVAVKHLFNHNYKRVEQFMTEVEILTRLRHRNLVYLYGCTSRQSRELLLVYEYIPNGTLASHLRGSSANPALLTWPVRIKIAVETASALAHLHASGIIHRDVKTNNILLDKNFCVKVSDFGLSRLFPDDVSHVSTAPQGTPGYLDPEYHYCFRLTNKSDVYSFGVVLIELISSMPVVDMGRNKDEITLASLAIRKIERNELEELVDPCLGIEKDSEVMKKVFAVGELAFQCLQVNNEMRPSMDEVLEILREIESEKEEGRDVEEGEANADTRFGGTPISYDQVEMVKALSSPNSVTVKWSSESTANFSL
ncbi:LEAF RUST 10 DISEASE-RESISTANCE LOCUS RECEPTOR-LIKE PROTEIN KINASE-like 1.1 [Neltuma alba]|uniref:LEAF RUST 10 DISEASE-RESISTANCE LOCUS RECEPTOR-LIKE PROTEIN KINASE-like 1.1 n=1 Tax=Neltuma alba TaxID=207710 RepID=UPI0010A36550|nr:LEAF RUST 10 DISEASE-RESISTANCE LOCUS RECEPTOR-LIKE PROTEIN KINASE-like 1.1 [Prosopis alba]